MARLRAYPRRRAADLDGIPHISLADWKETPVASDRKTTAATERMWWRDTGVLAYPPGAEVPDDELGDLVGDDEHQAALRGDPPPKRKRAR